MAAAIGAGLPVEETRASMVVDIGGGTTDVAVISLGGVVTSRTVRIGGDEIDEALVAHVKSEYSLLLGERSAEDLKIGAGSAFPLREELAERVRGRDLVTGLPKTVTIGSAEVRRAIETPLVQIVELVRTVLDVCPPELAGDVVDRGIALTGGGALIRGLDERLSHELGVPVRAADDPAARGRPRRRPVRRGVRHARARARRQPPALTTLSVTQPRRHRTLGVLIVATVLLLGLDLSQPGSTSFLRTGAAAAFGPLERALTTGRDDQVARLTRERDELVQARRQDAAAVRQAREVTSILVSPAAKGARLPCDPRRRLLPGVVIG